MSYPEPIEGETAESLYKQARFFYDQYEKEKKKVAKLEVEMCYCVQCEAHRRKIRKYQKNITKDVRK